MFHFGKLAVDLGTTNTVIWKDGEVVLFEPSVVSVNTENQKVVAAGGEAKKMSGKTPDYIEVVSPLRHGAIADYGAVTSMLKWFFREVMGTSWLFGPEVIVPVASGTTQVEQRAVMDAMSQAGARKVNLIDAPLAAAIGAKVSIADSFGNMVVNLGGGMVEAAIIASGGVVAVSTVREAGEKINETIEEYLNKKYSLAVGRLTVEDIKIKLGSAVKLKKEEILEVGGRDLTGGLPKTINLSSEEVFEVVRPELDRVVGVIKEVLGVTPPELVADVIDRGIVLTGGMSQMRGLGTFLTRETGVAVHVALEPEFCVVKGAAMVMENMGMYQKLVR